MLLVYGGSMAWDSVSSLETSGSAWDPHIWPFRLAIPLAALLLLIQGLAKLIADICIALGIELETEITHKRDDVEAIEESL
jgi:TRAP-type mannitol/chloroaromatic compound transport system permease small subunit